MLTALRPAEAYRRIDFDARVAGAGPRELTLICYEQLHTSLGSALHADRHSDNRRKSEALTRALAALTALQLGLDPSMPLTQPLQHMLESGRRHILDSVLAFDSARLAQVRHDFAEIRAALASTGS